MELTVRFSIKMVFAALAILFLLLSTFIVWASVNERYFFTSKVVISDFTQIDYVGEAGWDAYRSTITESDAKLGTVYLRISPQANNSSAEDLLIQIPYMPNIEVDSVGFVFDGAPFIPSVFYKASNYVRPTYFRHDLAEPRSVVFTAEDLGSYGASSLRFDFILIKETGMSGFLFSVILSMHHTLLLQLTGLNGYLRSFPFHL